MKYQVMYDNGSRLRVRSGQYAFTKEEGYGLASLLLNENFINEVLTSHRNGSILIYYDGGINNKQKIFDILDNISINNLFNAEPSQIQTSKEISENFYLKLTKMIFNRGIHKIFLPIPIRNIITIYHAAKYIWKGFDSLTSFNIDVALLDGAAVTGALLQKQYKPASSMMFLLSISDALEDYTLQKAKSTLRDSLTLNVDTVWVVGDDGNEKQCPVVEISKGDKIKIHMGDVIPVDGKVIE